MSDLGARDPAPLTGEECFRSSRGGASASVREFWSWSASDLLNNTTRGVLAEFVVGMDVGAAHGVRQAWAEYDLVTPEGVRVEVKSSARVQSWEQTRHSRLSFDIAPKHSLAEARPSGRSADVYVFCVLEGDDPLDLDRWTFLVLATAVLDRERPEQRTIGTGALAELGAAEVGFGEIAGAIRSALSGR